jgi:hypothetical protein
MVTPTPRRANSSALTTTRFSRLMLFLSLQKLGLQGESETGRVTGDSRCGNKKERNQKGNAPVDDGKNP